MEGKLNTAKITPTDYGVQEGVRYVVGCQTDDGKEYFSGLFLMPEEADGLASKIIGRNPDLAKRLELLRIKPTRTSVSPQVMGFTRDPARFAGLERIYENEGLAKCSLEGLYLKEEFLISCFEEEVFKTYES